MTKLVNHLKHNVVAYLALFVALGGTTYAATALPAGSVGSRQLRNGAVTNKKLAEHSVGAADLDSKTIGGYTRGYVQINGQGQIIAARPAAKVIAWRTGSFEPGGTIQWSRPISAACFALASTADPAEVSYANASLVGGSKGDALTYILLSTPGQAVNIAVVCPSAK